MPILEDMFNISMPNLIVHGLVILVGAAVAITSFAFLIPLDSVPAVVGVSTILAIAYGISILAWTIVITKYAKSPENLVWLNTHLMFLVLLPATIAATAMNVTSIQNTRNVMAGTVA